jgi:hygromycin-B 7''-O-kinase
LSPRSDQLSPPGFASQQDFISRLGNVRFWRPYLRQILRRHELPEPARAPIAGINATYPTFLSGDVVVKLFGGHPPWLQGYHAERRAHELLAQYPEIKAPRLLAHGHLLPGADATWPYLITSRVAGVASSRAELSAEQKSALVEELGWQVRYLHALPPPGATHNDDWQPVTSLKQRRAAPCQRTLPSKRKPMSPQSSHTIASSSTRICAPTMCSSRTDGWPGSSIGAMRW